MALYPASIANMAAQRRIQATIWGMGYVRVMDSGEINVLGDEPGLTGLLGWDQFSTSKEK